MALYRQIGGLRDDLTLHEKALDLLIDSLKTEQVWVDLHLLSFVQFTDQYIVCMLMCMHISPYQQLDESAPLGNLDKAISHFKVCICSTCCNRSC